jgi:peptidoglycan/LPS O-acetylase OafA/YrhL
MATAKRPNLAALTGARFPAALAVLLVHYQYAVADSLPAWTARTAIGGAGVSFFFVLSGFILIYNYLDRFTVDQSWRARADYVQSRFARIYPIYFVTLILGTAVALWLRGGPADPIRLDTAHAVTAWVVNLTMLQAFVPMSWIQGPYNAPAWSIGCEVFFYLLLPVLISAYFRKSPSRRSVLLFGGAAVAFQLLAFELATELRLNGTLGLAPDDAVLLIARFPPIRLGGFVVGCCAGYLYLRHAAGRGNRLLWLAIAGVVLVELMRFLASSVYFPRTVLHGPLFAVAIYALACGGTFLSPMLEARSSRLLGDASYSLYLIHWTPLVLVNAAYGRGDAPLAVAAAVMLLCIPVSVASYLLIERPARALMRGTAAAR